MDIYKANKEDYLSLKKMLGGIGDNNEPKTEAKPDVKPEAMPETKPEAKPKTTTDTNKKATTESKSESKTRPDPDVINVISITHNARLRCLLEDIIPEIMISYRKEIEKKGKNKKKEVEIRFKNCCILKISIKAIPKPKAAIEMIYEGNVNKKNRKPGSYFVGQNSPGMPPEDVVFLPIEFNLERLNINASDIPKKDVNIYFIRHGEARHNVGTSSHLVPDTLLTGPEQETGEVKCDENKEGINGIEQAKIAGCKLKKILKESVVSYFFCSELKRSRQTLAVIMKILNINKDMIVLPFSNEVSYIPGGKCDSKQSVFKAMENVATCSSTSKGELCSVISGIKVNWNVYKNHNKAPNTNMIKLILNIVDGKIDVNKN